MSTPRKCDKRCIAPDEFTTGPRGRHLLLMEYGENDWRKVWRINLPSYALENLATTVAAAVRAQIKGHARDIADLQAAMSIEDDD